MFSFFSSKVLTKQTNKKKLGFSLIKVLGIPVILILEKSLPAASHSCSTAAPQAGPGGCGRWLSFLPCPSTSGQCHLLQDPGQRPWAEGTKDVGSGQRKGPCLKKQHIGHEEI